MGEILVGQILGNPAREVLANTGNLLLLLKLTIINTTIKKLILHSVVLDPLENAKIKSVPKTSQYYAIYTKTFKKYVQILRI